MYLCLENSGLNEILVFIFRAKRWTLKFKKYKYTVYIADERLTNVKLKFIIQYIGHPTYDVERST